MIKLTTYISICLVLSCTMGTSIAYAQEGVVDAATILLEVRTKSLETYLKKSQKQRSRLLKKLTKKEAKLRNSLAQKDSLGHDQYECLPLTFDSIIALSKDTVYLNQFSKNANKHIDSLKKIQSFATEYLSKFSAQGQEGSIASINHYTQKIELLQQQLNTEHHLDELVRLHSEDLEHLAKLNVLPGLKSIQKKVFYARERMKILKELAQEPDEAETEALEFLRGTSGFSELFAKGNNSAWGGLGNTATVEDLERLGFQTKRQTAEVLQQNFGNNLAIVEKSMGSQIQQFQEQMQQIGIKINDVKTTVASAKESIATMQQEVRESKERVRQLKKSERPTFKVNPERGKPFLQRIERQYNFQTTRSTQDGRPAMLDISIGAGFKHTPKLNYGLGLSATIGLGQGWEHFKLSYEGVGFRFYMDYILRYGISVQTGFERVLRPYNRSYINNYYNEPNHHPNIDTRSLKEAFGAAQDAAYIGLMKRYRLSHKWNGTFLLGYNFLWQQSGTRTPWLVRVGWSK